MAVPAESGSVTENDGGFWSPYEAYMPDAHEGFLVAFGYSPLSDFERMLRQNGWDGEIKFRPMTKWIKRKHGWGRDNDPGGPWRCTMGYVDRL